MTHLKGGGQESEVTSNVNYLEARWNRSSETDQNSLSQVDERNHTGYKL